MTGTILGRHSFNPIMIGKIIIQGFLSAAFMAFNAGMPVINLTCALVSGEENCCQMQNAENDNTPLYNSNLPDCCTKHMTADRETIPYVNQEKYEILKTQQTVKNIYFWPENFGIYGNSPVKDIIHRSTSPPSSNNIPLIILNASLLI